MSSTHSHKDLGVMVCIACMNTVPFEWVRWDKVKQSYVCLNCKSK